MNENTKAVHLQKAQLQLVHCTMAHGKAQLTLVQMAKPPRQHEQCLHSSCIKCSRELLFFFYLLFITLFYFRFFIICFVSCLYCNARFLLYFYLFRFTRFATPSRPQHHYNGTKIRYDNKRQLNKDATSPTAYSLTST
uniref:Uncharacterized protein n=1 Tax=Romanomermis culicivorax TaxID=13658 RepID=A0A915L3Y4_ROMCU